MSSLFLNFEEMLLTLGREKYDQPNKGQLVRWASAHSIICQHFPPPPQPRLSWTSQLPAGVDGEIHGPLCAVVLLLSYMTTQKTPLTSVPLALAGEGYGHTTINGAIDALPGNVTEETLEDANPLADAPFEDWPSDPGLEPAPSRTNHKRRSTRKRPRVDHEDAPRRNKRRRHCARVSLAYVTSMEGTPKAHQYAWNRRGGCWQVTPGELLEEDLLNHLDLHEDRVSIYVRPEAGDTVRMELHEGEEFIGWDKLGSRKYRVSIGEMKYLLQYPDQHVEFTYRLHTDYIIHNPFEADIASLLWRLVT